MNITAINRLRMNTDGKGVRTLICLSSCPLSCKYCINPQTWGNHMEYTSLSLEEVYHFIQYDTVYYQATNGGITFGGGEPLLQSQSIAEFSQRYKGNWTINLETSLNVPLHCITDVIPYIDHYYIDIKDMNNEIYKRYTGKDNTLVMSNLKYLIQEVGADRITIRLPSIKEYNTSNDIIKSKEQLTELGFTDFDEFEYIIKE